jgi:hypothetical protein
MSSNAIKLGLKFVIHWLSQFLDDPRPEPQKKLNPIERHDIGDRHLWRFLRNTPAEVASWNIHVDGYNAQLLFFVDNLAKLEFISDFYQKASVVTGFEESKVVKRTHLISIEWVVRLQSGANVARRIGYWVGDLQGSDPNINRKAYDILMMLARDVYTIKESNELSWRKRIEAFPWDEAIESICIAKLPGVDIRLKKIETKMTEVTAQTKVKFPR